ncbi:MAG: hypothetical protein M3Q14_01910 [bacterium]|nr:hypothetical protein [bacterium]
MQDQVNTAQDYTSRFLERVVDGLPAFLGALLVLVVSYFVAKVLANAVLRLLNGAQLNDRLVSVPGGNFITRAVPSPASFVSKVVYWLVFLFGVSLAIAVLGVPLFNEFLRSVYGYLPNVLAALVIFLVAGAISAAIVTLVGNTMGHTPTGKVVATAAPIVVMSIAAFMILNQLKIAPAIVTITYAALIGSASLGTALAFGLGGRDVASRMLEDMYVKGRATKEQAKRDIKVGAQNAKAKANKLR